MSITEILFYAFSGVLLVSAIGVITARNPVHAALFLVFSFVNSAVLWMLLEAEFLAIVLVLVYVGAVMVLFLFVVMMLDINVAQMREGFTRYAPLGILIALRGLVAGSPAVSMNLRAIPLVLGSIVLFALLVERAGLPIATVACIVVASLASREAKVREVVLLSITLAATATALFVYALALCPG